MSAAVGIRLCQSMIESELSGYEGYPNTELGLARFARALQDVALSVDHARAIVAMFTVRFPTVQDIIDTGLNLRPQFEAKQSQEAAWRAKYGEPQPVALEFKVESQPFAERDRKIRAHITKSRGNWPGWKALGWLEIFEAQEAVGYPLTPEQRKMIGR